MQHDEPQGNVGIFRAEYYDIFGDHLVALMFAQIVYWYQPNSKGASKLRKYRDGRWWLVKSHVHWWEELRLTRKQSTRCLEVLRKMGVIETNRWLFDGHPTVHLRCTLISGRSLTNAQLGALHCALKNIPLLPQAQCITEITTETTTETVASGDALPKKVKPGVGKVQPHMQVGEENVATAAELLAGMKSKSAAPGKVTPSAMGMRWKKLLGADGGFVKELTSKQLGQLKHLHKSLGDNAMAVMEFAVLNWNAFCWEARASKGLSTTPTLPDIGFLQQYHDVAVQLIAKKTAKPTVQPVAQVESSPPAAVKVEPPAEDKATADDVLATLAALEAMHPSA